MFSPPVNVMGPAHRGTQLAALAQTAAQNVMRRQRMRSLINNGASGARPPGLGQPLATAGRGLHTPGMPTPGHGVANAGSDMQSQLLAILSGGQYNPSGGGGDFGSLPNTDPTQPHPQVGNPGGVMQPGAPALPPGTNPGGAAQWTSGAPSGGADNPGGGAQWAGTGPAAGTPSGGLIPLSGGLFYDPATDTVVGGGGAAGGGVGSGFHAS